MVCTVRTACIIPGINRSREFLNMLGICCKYNYVLKIILKLIIFVQLVNIFKMLRQFSVACRPSVFSNTQVVRTLGLFRDIAINRRQNYLEKLSIAPTRSFVSYTDFIHAELIILLVI